MTTADEIPAAPRDGAQRAAPEVTVTACPDGPLLLRGPASILGPDGEPVERRRATVALCRCGGTAIAPWCDGTHKVNGYRSGDSAV